MSDTDVFKEKIRQQQETIDGHTRDIGALNGAVEALKLEVAYYRTVMESIKGLRMTGWPKPE